MASGDSTYVRKSNGSVVATIIETAHGKIINDCHGRTLGVWLRDVDLTNDIQGRNVGRGDLLTTLLPPGTFN